MLCLCAGPGNTGTCGGPLHAPAGLWGELQGARKSPTQRDPLNAGMLQLRLIASRTQPRSLSSASGEVIPMLWRPAQRAQQDVYGHWLLNRTPCCALLASQQAADWGTIQCD